jgi:hypothetical protein
MRVERVRPNAVQVTLHPLELASLVAAARWVIDGAADPLPPEAVKQLRQVVHRYDTALRNGGRDATGADRTGTYPAGRPPPADG